MVSAVRAPTATGAAPGPGLAVVLDEEQFARDVAMMLSAGLTLLESIRTLRERADSRTAPVIDRLTLRLMEGHSLSAAMESCHAFRPALLAAVRSSEVTGDLAENLQRYAQNAARLREMRSRLVSALIYPSMLVVVAGLVVLFLIGFVVPRFATVLEGAGRELPWLSQVLIQSGRFVASIPAEGLVLLAGTAAWLLWQLVQAARAGRLERALSQAAARLPVVRDLVRAFALSQFTRTASMLVRAGIPAIKSLGMGRELLLPADQLRLDAAMQAASTGSPLAAALHEHGLVDGFGLRVLRVAEQTGELQVALERLAEIHEVSLSRALDRFGRLVEPVLMLAIGLVIGGIVVLMYLPIFQLAASVG